MQKALRFIQLSAITLAGLVIFAYLNDFSINPDPGLQLFPYIPYISTAFIAFIFGLLWFE